MGLVYDYQERKLSFENLSALDVVFDLHHALEVEEVRLVAVLAGVGVEFSGEGLPKREVILQRLSVKSCGQSAQPVGQANGIIPFFSINHSPHLIIYYQQLTYCIISMFYSTLVQIKGKTALVIIDNLFSELAQAEQIMDKEQQVQKKIPVQLLLWLIIAATIAYAVKYGLILLTIFIKLILNIFFSTGETLKSYVWLLVAWMFIFCNFKSPPFSQIIYKSMTNILIPVDQECSICLNESCDVSIEECQHCFHIACLQNWRKKNTTCPNCRIQIKPQKNNLSMMFATNFIKKHRASAIAIAVAWLLVTVML